MTRHPKKVYAGCEEQNQSVLKDHSGFLGEEQVQGLSGSQHSCLDGGYTNV